METDEMDNENTGFGLRVAISVGIALKAPPITCVEGSKKKFRKSRGIGVGNIGR